MTTKEGYVYEITENKVEYIGKQGENPPPDLQESDIEFKLNPAGFTNTDVTVEIITKTDIGTNTLQYSTDGTSWEKYSTAITFQENGTIYARLINPLNEVGGVATKEIDKIDKQDPKQATVSFSPTSIDTDTEIIATVTQSDNGVSGVNLAGSKWAYTTSDTLLGKNETSYTGGFFQVNQTEVKTKITTSGTYYLHILTVDNAKNKTETVKGPIIVTKPQAKVGEIVTGDNKEYTKNGTAIIPVGFAIKPGCDDIANGLVISDVANDTNDTGNQFVWIPVTDMSHYVRDMTFPIVQCYNGKETYSQGSGYLPSGISSEELAVSNAGGFYLARYETGAGVVSKKGASPINRLTYEQTKNQAKSFINTKYVKSSVVSGSQWDYTMWLLNGKKDAMGGTFNVRVKNYNRQPNYSQRSDGE